MGLELRVWSSEADVLPSCDPLETCVDLAASIREWRLCFLGLETVEDRDGDGEEVREVVEEGMLAALICSDSFCFFLVVGGGDAELGDNEGVSDDTTDTFLLFFDCGLAVIDSVCVDFAVDSDKAAAG